MASATTTTTTVVANKKNKDRKQKVRFSERVQCRKTLSRRGYTANEIRQTWISADEMEEMAEQRQIILNQLEEVGQSLSSSSSSPNDDDDDDTMASFRGLESWTVQGTKQMANAVESCWYAVLSEQEKQLQWYSNNNYCINTDRLAKASQKVSIISKCLAYERAQTDEREAQKVLYQTTTTTTTTVFDNVEWKWSSGCFVQQQQQQHSWTKPRFTAVLRQ
eukprot:scaffold7489_cov96-Cylindrotheca_fusiformis.AAC.1